MIRGLLHVHHKLDSSVTSLLQLLALDVVSVFALCPVPHKRLQSNADSQLRWCGQHFCDLVLLNLHLINVHPGDLQYTTVVQSSSAMGSSFK